MHTTSIYLSANPEYCFRVTERMGNQSFRSPYYYIVVAQFFRRRHHPTPCWNMLLHASVFFLLCWATLVSCKEINSTQDLTKEETRQAAIPWHYNAGSGSKSSSFSKSSSKSQGEGTGEGSGYGGSENTEAGHRSKMGASAGYGGPSEQGLKSKLKVFSYEAPGTNRDSSSESYGSQRPYETGYGINGDGSYSGDGYGKGQDSSSPFNQGYAQPTGYSGAHNGEHYGSQLQNQPNSQSPGYDDENSYSNGNFRKNLRAPRYKTTLVKEVGKPGQQGEYVSVFIKQLKSQPSTQQFADTSSGNYGRESTSQYDKTESADKKGYLLLPVVANQNAGGYRTGYSSSDKNIQTIYSSPESQNYESGQFRPYNEATKLQGYKAAANPESQPYVIEGGSGEGYAVVRDQISYGNEDYNIGTLSRGKPNQIQRPSAQTFNPTHEREGRNYKSHGTVEDLTSRLYPTFDNAPQQKYSQQQNIPSGGEDYAGGSQQSHYQPSSNEESPYNAQYPSASSKPKQPTSGRSGSFDGNFGNYGLSFSPKVQAMLNEDVKVKHINPNLYTSQVQQLPGMMPQSYQQQPLQDYISSTPGKRQVVNHGPKGISVSYQNIGNHQEFSGLDGLQLSLPYERNQVMAGKATYGPQYRSTPQAEQKTKSIAVFLQKQKQQQQQQYQPNRGSFSPSMVAKNGVIPSLELLHSMNPLGSSLIPMSFPYDMF